MHLHQFKYSSQFIYFEGSPEQGVGGGEKSETPKEEKSYEERLLEQKKAREESPGGVGEINQENLTDSSKWSTELLDEAKNKMTEVDTKEEAELFIRRHSKAWQREFFFPTRGEVLLTGESELQRYRVGTADDWRQIYQNILEMKELLTAVCNIYHLEPGFSGVFDNMAGKAERRTDEGRLQQELDLMRSMDYPRYTPPANPEQK